jgi:hypothetical protein
MIIDSATIGLISAACISLGIMLGIFLQRVLPQHHLDAGSKDTIKLGSGLLSTLTALVLGLLVGSAQNSFNTMSSAIAQAGTKAIMLDQVLASYGPDAKEARQQLRRSVSIAIDRIWSNNKQGPTGLRAVEAGAGMQTMQSKLRELTPKNNEQQALLAQAQAIGTEVSQSRLLMIEEQQHILPPVFLVLLISWLTMLFLTFGLFAPRNATVFTILLICAVSVSSAIFLILEMERPLDGFIRVSDAPLRKVLDFVGK